MAWANWSKYLRAATKSTLIVIAVFLGLSFFHQFLLPLAAFLLPSLDTAVFDLGSYGAYPTQQYASFNLESPLARRLRWDDACDPGLVLLTPNGPSVARPGPMILDSRGDLVWMSDDFGATANFKVQHYQGEDYLTLWSGEKAATSGKGVYFMLDSTYQVVRMVSAVGEGMFGDLHEFKITKEGTGLLSVYNTTPADLRGMGMGRPRKGWIVDNLFQEINIETGELLFEWSAADHFNPVDTHYTNPFGGYWESIPFDFYHLNSIDKDSQGNYLISSRHFHHIMSISPTGETLWILGGENNQFHDLSDGQATNFKWQHDARWISEEDGLLTLFDNSKAGPLHSDAPESRALIIQLDLENKTAKLVQSMTSLQGILASSQGSVQLLPDSHNFFVGWGSAAAYSEYSHDGDLMCETHLGASWFYWFERMKSYRTTKVFNWHGMPREAPKVNIEDDLLTVSWNGATEVAFWALEATEDVLPQNSEDVLDSNESQTEKVGEEVGNLISFATIDVILKTGFEGAFDLSHIPSDKTYTRFRVAALDADHNLLRYSELCEPDYGNDSSYLIICFKLFIVVGFLVGARFAFKSFRNSGCLRSWASSSPAPGFTPGWMDWITSSGYRRAEQSAPGMYEWVHMKWTSATSRPR